MTESVSFCLPCVEQRHLLTGSPGPLIDSLVALLVSAGALIEVVRPGAAYRVHAAAALVSALAGELEETEDLRLQLELPPEGTRLSSALRPREPFRRHVTVHGTSDAFLYVARAIDRGLKVDPVGVHRWQVSAPTADLVAWLRAAVFPGDDDAATMARFGWTAETVAAEDRPAPAVQVVLPDRRITSAIQHDAAGRIVAVSQTETSL
jgi:hypothetical protein